MAHAKTVADYLALPGEWGTELVEGEFVDGTPAPGPLHQHAILRFGARLDAAVRAGTLGCVHISPFDVRLSESTIVQPDVLFVATANAARLGEFLTGPPDIAVEFLSARNRDHDLRRKRQLYLKHGVPEYWIGDPVARTLLLLENSGADWRTRALVDRDGVATSPLLPGVGIRLADVYLD